MNLTISLSPLKITKFLFGIVLGLVGLSILTVTIGNFSGNKFFELISHIFNVDKERNIPTFFSVLLLWTGSFLCALITFIKKQKGDRYTIHWGFLALIFLILGWDEAVQIHDSGLLAKTGITDYLISMLGIKPEEFFTFRWVVVAIPIVFLLGLSYLKFVFSFPIKQKKLLIAAGITYVTGSVGMEIISGFFIGNKIIYAFFSASEELFEMSGVVIFISFLLLHLSSCIEQISINFQKVDETLPSARLIQEKSPNFVD